MAKLYVGDSQGAPAIVKVEEVPKLKFGASVNAFLGDVDENGFLQKPTNEFILDLTGVKGFNVSNIFENKFNSTKIKQVIANDLTTLFMNDFVNAFSNCMSLTKAEFNNLESITTDKSFNNAFYNCPYAKITFNKLKIVSGPSAFNNGLRTFAKNVNIEETFPLLEEISGNGSFTSFISFFSDTVVTFPSIKKISGGTAYYQSTFGNVGMNGTIWNFPNAIEFTKSIWNTSASYTGEIHFAAANQAAIEACDGYADKWGFAGATIYFDL